MKQLLALLLFVPSLCLAQVPEYVTTDGLVAWYPLDSTALDESGNGHHLTLDGPTWGAGTGGAGDQALLFDGQDDVAFIPHHPDFNTPELSLSFWTIIHTDQLSDSPGLSDFMGMVNKTDAEAGVLNRHQFDVQLYAESAGTSPFNLGWLASTGQSVSGLNVEVVTAPASLHSFEWNHIVVTASDSTLNIHINGDHIATNELLHPRALNTADIRIGRDWAGFAERHFNGRMDDIAFYNRVLTDEEVQTLFMATAPEYGCTDPEACNFQPDAALDDGSCISCEVLASACGEGTVWDSTLAQCISIADTVFIEPEACAPSCGEGTVWDPVNEECIIAIPADLNYDGCVSVNDLLVLLAVHGTCPPYPEWPDEPSDTIWTCGAPLTYWDYDYATVLIGDQCWFAENLRTDLYSDGQEIPDITDQTEWSQTNAGARCFYENDSLSHFEDLGSLYNWFTTVDSRGVCPNGWHVPDDSDFISMEIALGMSPAEANSSSSIAWRGTDQGDQIKATSSMTPGWDGTNTSDFGFLPGGTRGPYSDGEFGAIYLSGWLWCTNSTNSTVAVGRALTSSESRINRTTTYQKRNGFSVRCLQD